MPAGAASSAVCISGAPNTSLNIRLEGHAWRSKYRDELQLQLLTADPHSPPEFRANGTVMNHDAFEAAFGVKPGDRMYKAPADRIRIW